ncbi:MAG: hypothetical protein QW445_07455 [Candidatus Bathyarchaeia archaeon]
MKYVVTASKIVVETWCIEAENEKDAVNNLFIKGELVNTKVKDWTIESIENADLMGDDAFA